MSYESLQYLCWGLIAIGGIIAILATFGASHYGYKAQKEKDDIQTAIQANQKKATQTIENDKPQKSKIANLTVDGVMGHGIYSRGQEIEAKNIKVKKAGGDAVHLEALPVPSTKPTETPK